MRETFYMRDIRAMQDEASGKGGLQINSHFDTGFTSYCGGTDIHFLYRSAGNRRWSR